MPKRRRFRAQHDRSNPGDDEQNRAPYRGKQQHSDHRPLLFTRSASAAIRLSASGEIFSLDIPNSATAVSSTEPLKKVRTSASSAERRASVLTVADENT